jgi:hypothetical protein
VRRFEDAAQLPLAIRLPVAAELRTGRSAAQVAGDDLPGGLAEPSGAAFTRR